MLTAWPSRTLAVAFLLQLAAAAAAAQPAMPRCGPALEGQPWSNCTCGYDGGGSITAHAAGWRWTCDLLRGPDPAPPVQSAGDPAAGLPGGFAYAPQTGAVGGAASQAPMATRLPFR